MLYRTIVATIMAGLLGAACASAQTADAARAPSAKEDLARIRSLFSRPDARTREEFYSKLRANLKAALAAVAKMERDHPDAAELDQARVYGLRAAYNLARMTNDAAMAAKARAIIKTVLAGKAPALAKLTADAHGVMLTLQPVGAAATQPATQPARLIARLARRYAKTDAAVEALLTARSIAKNAGQEKLAWQLEEQLLEEHPDHPAAREVKLARASGAARKVGNPFKATLTRLDGTKLTLPDDLKGKVLVVDFWATWCGPCVGEIPHMKAVYAEYKPKGVEFVGISLDRAGDKDKLARFVKDRGMDWIHTHSGRSWNDPTARTYGIRSIPSIWVIGKDGAIFSNNARRNLEAALDAALKAEAPTTRPAKG